jgi:hypothetical protein
MTPACKKRQADGFERRTRKKCGKKQLCPHDSHVEKLAKPAICLTIAFTPIIDKEPIA